jgi:hypothetical protein
MSFSAMAGKDIAIAAVATATINGSRRSFIEVSLVVN